MSLVFQKPVIPSTSHPTKMVMIGTLSMPPSRTMVSHSLVTMVTMVSLKQNFSDSYLFLGTRDMYPSIPDTIEYTHAVGKCHCITGRPHTRSLRYLRQPAFENLYHQRGNPIQLFFPCEDHSCHNGREIHPLCGHTNGKNSWKYVN